MSVGNGAVTKAGAEQDVGRSDCDTSQHRGSSFDFISSLELLQFLVVSVLQHCAETIKSLG